MSKTFFFATLLGVAFGFILGGYVGYAAFQPPTGTPPGNNVAPPLNTSNAGQEKVGGLTLNTGGATDALIIAAGYVKLALSGAPDGNDCNESSERGRMIYDDIANTLYICDGTAWQSH